MATAAHRTRVPFTCRESFRLGKLQVLFSLRRVRNPQLPLFDFGRRGLSRDIRFGPIGLRDSVRDEHPRLLRHNVSTMCRATPFARAPAEHAIDRVTAPVGTANTIQVTSWAVQDFPMVLMIRKAVDCAGIGIGQTTALAA